MEREFETGPVIAAVGGVLLLVSLFLDWYGEFSGWTSFETLDLVLAGLALAAILAGAAGFGAPDVIGERALPILGGVGLLIVVSQLISHPPLGVERDIEIGAWLGLLGAIAMLAGGIVGTARVSVAVQVADRAGTRAAEPAPDTAPDAAPAPARGGLFDAPAPVPAPAPQRDHSQDPPASAPTAVPESETAATSPQGDPFADEATARLGEEKTTSLGEDETARLDDGGEGRG